MKGIIYIFIFFCFFPYLDLFQLGTDTQPNALILASLLLFALPKKKINAPIALLGVVFILSLFLFIGSGASSFYYVKNALNYLAPLIVCFATYNVLLQEKITIPFKYFLAVILCYAFVGLIQYYLDPFFLTSLVNGSARGIMIGGRGVVSLCPEPAFYGTMCIFLMVFSLLNYSKKENLLALSILLFQLFFLSKSLTAVVIFFLALAIFLVTQIIRFRLKYIMSTVVILLLAMYIGNRMIPDTDTRIGQLTESFIQDPLLITKVDASVGVRFTGAIAPYLSWKYNHLLPMGIGHYKSFLQKIYRTDEGRQFLTPIIVNEKDTLGGGANMIIYQLGFLGLIFPFAIYLAFREGIKTSALCKLSFLLFICILFTQIQLMHSMIGFIIAFALNKKNLI